jgi:TPR repeat protein
MGRICYLITVLFMFTLGLPAFAQQDKEAAQAADLNSLKIQAENGDVGAQLHLSKIYYKGSPETPKNNEESLKWLRMAADKGSAKAQYNLASAYYHGTAPLEKDYVMAHMWLELALMHDSSKNARVKEKATMRNNEIEELMSTEQIVKAHELAQDWLKKHPK